ncbi:acetyl-CoA acetyltransferase [Pseudomonas sp. GM78]|uniref:thiolase C-terminal domain-containing protein n=1 Tax=Pseudomonas sp. GM78 TaxID=1144337 RepID=UPI00026FC244|nr:acetyl-CoA acetyltransferase [Pseudomonas sp. GM78]EJN35072.1 acetyl-CoA acetyltransferase [Pseudomonas sp. GM78]
MNRRVNVIGVGMTPFIAPGAGGRYYDLAAEAGRLALQDAGIEYRRVEAAYAGFVYGDSLSGQRGVTELGLTGIPIINVSNHGASGSTALYLARQAIEHGIAECVLAVGFEVSPPEWSRHRWQDCESPVARHAHGGADTLVTEVPIVTQLFARAAREYMQRYGARKETFAMIAVKSREHAALNPYALHRQPLSLETVLEDEVCTPLTRLQYCLPASGAAAVVLCSDEFARKHGINDPVYIAAQAMTTDLPGSFSEGSAIRAMGYELGFAAARDVYERAGIGPEEVDVCELHDGSTASEILLYEALGLCREGDAEKLVEDGDNTYGGNRVINPSGGLLSMGHPLGATGIAQCAELVWQLRGTAANRQVPYARIALQHNISIGGACVVTMYRCD